MSLSSVQTRTIDNGDQWSQGFDEVVTALDVGQPHLVGASSGRRIALRSMIAMV